jgi:methylated-DNA-[protein]-cysteine S-methyltransferase
MKNTISFNTKFGWISISEVNNLITRIQFGKLKKIGKKTKILSKCKSSLISYLGGRKNKICAPIKLEGNILQKKIWNILKKIPKGKTLSYRRIAKKLKVSPRYVGKVCGQNKHVLAIPCHRVIKSDGSLGGFSSIGGVSLKQKLLDFESW